MRRITRLLIVFLLLLTGVASSQLFGKPHTQAQLILSQTKVAPGSELKAVFRLTMEEHWHTYWKYAGEVGLPTEAAWEL
ncbi:MAG: thioredoxin, partial [Candidatus Eremiobacteraeota bacterium]|nr:thioredoxin [Candidatus Eremiobacteraeota bacterium]